MVNEDAVKQVREESDAIHMLAEAFDRGFTACANEHTKQRRDPSYPITRVNPYRT